MVATKDERDRILQLVESGQLNAQEASELFEVLEGEQERYTEQRTLASKRDRLLRIRATNLSPHARSGQQRLHMSATMPVSLVRASLRLGTQILPQLKSNSVEDLLRALESGASGRLLDLHDLENGERVEIFVE